MHTFQVKFKANLDYSLYIPFLEPQKNFLIVQIKLLKPITIFNQNLPSSLTLIKFMI